MRRALPLLVVIPLLAGCGGGRHATTTASTTTTGPTSTTGRARLVGLLAVLRRPATAADTTPALQAALAQWAHYSSCAAEVADPGLTRRVGTAPGGAGLFLVAFRPARCAIECTGTARACQRPLPRTEWAALTVAPAADQELSGEWTARDITTGHATGFLPGPPEGRTLTVALVPDGITHVAMTVGPIGQPPTRTVSVAVHNNVAVLAAAPNTNVELKPY